MAAVRAQRNIMDLQNMREHRMLFILSWPVIMSLFIQGLYNFVDSVFIARFGAEALSALSIAFVVQNLASSFFTGIATGMNAVISRAIGAGNHADAKSAVKNGLVVQGAFSLVFLVFGLFFTGFYFTQTTDNAQVIAYGIDYLGIVMVFSPVMAAQISFERFLQSTGMTRYMLYSQLAGTLVNIVLDPIMIFGLLGCPAMGIRGAAYATVIGQLVATLVALYFNVRKNSLLFARGRRTAYDWKMAKLVMKIGLPTAATGVSASFGNYFINRILISFSAEANAAFGIYAKLQNLALMPTQGMSAGLVTMYSFFYGKRDLARMKKTLVSGEIMVQVWNTFCFLVFFSIPTILMIPFSPSEAMIAAGIPCFRIIAVTYLTSGLMTGLTAFFQATGWSIYTFFVSLSRTVFVRVPVAYYLASFNDVDLIWWCWPISEVVSDTVCLLLFIANYKKVKKELQAGYSLNIASGTT